MNFRHKISHRIFLTISLILGLIVFFLIYAGAFNKEELSEAQFLYVGGTQFTVDVASTNADRAKGLSGREDLAPGHGLLFAFAQEGFYSFWMKDMNFPIDIVWIDSDWVVRDITQNIAPESFPASYRSFVPIQYVLEVNAWGASDIEIGDVVSFSKKAR